MFLMNAKFMPFFKECLTQSEQFEEILNAGEEKPTVCYNAFCQAYQAFPDGIPEDAFDD